jgi:hypothetical protein
MLLTEQEKKARLQRAFSGLRNVPDKLHRATQALFWEHRHASRWKEKGIIPVYNLSKRDHDDTLSMQQIYFQCASEYEAAMVLLGDWEHWERLTSCKWFQPHLCKWRQEKARRDSHMGRSKIIELAEQGNLAAAKYLDQNKETHEELPTVPDKNKEDGSPVPEAEEKPQTPVIDDDWIKNSLQLARREHGD